MYFFGYSHMLTFFAIVWCEYFAVMRGKASLRKVAEPTKLPEKPASPKEDKQKAGEKIIRSVKQLAKIFDIRYCIHESWLESCLNRLLDAVLEAHNLLICKELDVSSFEISFIAFFRSVALFSERPFTLYHMVSALQFSRLLLGTEGDITSFYSWELHSQLHAASTSVIGFAHDCVRSFEIEFCFTSLKVWWHILRLQVMIARKKRRERYPKIVMPSSLFIIFRLTRLQRGLLE